MKNVIKATLALFKCVPECVRTASPKVAAASDSASNDRQACAPNTSAEPQVLAAQAANQPIEAVSGESLEHGVFILPTALQTCPEVGSEEILSFIYERYGSDPVSLNQGFHKSFKAVADRPRNELLYQQLLHYFTTFVPEALGLREGREIYVPLEELHLPEPIEPGKLRLICIGSMTVQELEERLMALLTSRVALSENSLGYILDIIKGLKLNIDPDKINNKEAKVRLYELYGLTPKDPAEFLRFLVYITTGSSLLVKNEKQISLIDDISKTYNSTISRKPNGGAKFCPYEFKPATHLRNYVQKYGLEPLASIFLRFKPLWLAFKNKASAPYINKMRKLAKKVHKPLPRPLLGSLTSAGKIDLQELRKELGKVSLFKKVALANCLRLYQTNPNGFVYIVRTGRLFAKERSRTVQLAPEVGAIVEESIMADIKSLVSGKRIYIPENVSYAMPTGEKQFVDNVPFGSSLKLGKNVVVAVHWENLPNPDDPKGWRVDLDLHMVSPDYSLGWDTYLQGDYDKHHDVIFSGDMVNAPRDSGGATEAFFVSRTAVNTSFMISLNRYAVEVYDEDDVDEAVPFKLVIDSADSDRVAKDYLINAYTMFPCLNGVIDEPERVLGLLHTDEEGQKTFYFVDLGYGRGIVAHSTPISKLALEALRAGFTSRLTVREVLARAGAVLTSKGEDCDVDLSPEKLTKDSIISLFIKPSQS